MPSIISISLYMATSPAHISSKDGWISSGGGSKPSPLSSGVYEYLIPTEYV